METTTVIIKEYSVSIHTHKEGLSPDDRGPRGTECVLEKQIYKRLKVLES